MRIVVLDRSPHGNAADARSDALLAECVRALGVSADVVDVGDASPEATAARVGDADAVLVRADLRSRVALHDVVAIARAVESRGVPCLPSSDGVHAAEDKAETHRRLRAVVVPAVPWTPVSADDVRDPGAAAARVGGFPVALKLPVSWGGDGVTRCDTAADLAHGLAASGDAPALVERWIEHERTFTVLVARGRALSSYAMRRGADPRSNARHGGTPEAWGADPATAAHAVRAVAACDLAFGSVDFVGGAGEPLCLEVNSMPGLWPDDPEDRAFAAAIAADAVAAARRAGRCA